MVIHNVTGLGRDLPGVQERGICHVPGDALVPVSHVAIKVDVHSAPTAIPITVPDDVTIACSNPDATFKAVSKRSKRFRSQKPTMATDFRIATSSNGAILTPSQDVEEGLLHVVHSLAAELLDTLISLRQLTKGGGDKAREAENLGGAHDEIVCLRCC